MGSARRRHRRGGGHLAATDLPAPGVIVTAGDRDADTFAGAARALGGPFFCLALEETPAGIDAALEAGMKVIGLTTTHAATDLGRADLVIPSLRSLHVVGTHPVLVLEVDALPGAGPSIPGRFGRR